MSISTNKPFTLWLMGPTSSGKTTLSLALLEALRASGKSVLHLDGDEVRDLFGDCHGFSAKDRLRVVNACIFYAQKAIEGNTSVIVSALTANPEARKMVNENCPNLLTGFIDCDIATCMERDPKGLYAKAAAGEIDTLIGYNTDYIPPENPDLVIRTQDATVSENVSELIDFLESKGLLGKQQEESYHG